MMRTLVLVATVLLAGCAEELDTTGLPSADDYGSWAYYDVHGFIPGHGESWRAIFISPEAREYITRYPDGSVLVKEVRTLKSDPPAAGGLEYIAIMRKVEHPPAGVKTEGGWVFSYKTSADGPEYLLDTCWGSCHVQAPYDGAFLDYSRVGTDP